MSLLASIPSPAQGVWHLGPFPLRAYALCIILGIVLACVLTEKRFVARGGIPGEVLDIAVWAVPFGIIGGRIYHVITTPEPYFGEGGDPIRAFAIWEGGLGIWGAILLGGVGAWIACRRRGIPLPVFADAIAPGLLVAQAVGRVGNYFNQELYGKPTTLPWALEIDPAHRVSGYLDIGLYHPTFLYELIWNLATAAVVIWADRRFRLGHGRAFALYVALYCLGRGAIEMLRIDTAEQFFGLRLNVFTAIVVGVLALVYLVALRGRPREELTRGADAAAVAAGTVDDDDRTDVDDDPDDDPDGEHERAELARARRDIGSDTNPVPIIREPVAQDAVDRRSRARRPPDRPAD